MTQNLPGVTQNLPKVTQNLPGVTPVTEFDSCVLKHDLVGGVTYFQPTTSKSGDFFKNS